MKVKLMNKVLLFVCLVLLVFIQNISTYNLSSKSSTNIKHKSNANKSDLSIESTLAVESTLGMRSLFSNLLSKVNIKNLSGLKQVVLSSDELGHGPIYCEGWNKFLCDEQGEKHDSFELNNEFTSLVQKKSEYPEEVPKNNQEFYFEVNGDYINTYTSKLVIIFLYCLLFLLTI